MHVKIVHLILLQLLGIDNEIWLILNDSSPSMYKYGILCFIMYIFNMYHLYYVHFAQNAHLKIICKE